MELWGHVLKTVNPLEKRDNFSFGRPLPMPEELYEDAPRPPQPEQDFVPWREAPKTARPQALEPRAEGLLGSGNLDGMDRRQADRFRKGLLPMDAVLDLHGMSQQQAHAALDGYIADCWERNLRCVLVITGKGTAAGSDGVLKARVPDWLNMAPSRSRVLAFTTARHHHGGTGALYVMLKRRRLPDEPSLKGLGGRERSSEALKPVPRRKPKSRKRL